MTEWTLTFLHVYTGYLGRAIVTCHATAVCLKPKDEAGVQGVNQGLESATLNLFVSGWHVVQVIECLCELECLSPVLIEHLPLWQVGLGRLGLSG